MVTMAFRVQGMSCQGCAQSVVRRLQSTAGVQSAEVDLASATANVSFDENVTNADSLEKVIESLGFDVLYGKA
ncbi:MAG TPA: heavy metal-associated domain-containing protein [Armatimonadota bacterium]|jgi:copper chaperone CopZ